MTAKEQLLAKLQRIKQSTQSVMGGGESDEPIVTDVTEDQEELTESI